ncbi:MAG: TolC family protein [Mariprofundaceae bacterium]|nr:TolC family protein [Mariprofundaceae bacterium]
MLLSLLLVPVSAAAQEATGLGRVLHQLELVSPQLSVSRAQAQAAQAGVVMARSKYWGHAEIFGRDTHYNSARLVNPISPPINFAVFATDSNQYTYGAALTLPVDIDGRITAVVRAQQHLSKAAAYHIEDARLVLFAQATSLYRGLQRLAGVRQALIRQQQALNKHRDITGAAIRVGRSARVELLRIDAEIKAVEGKTAALDGDTSRMRADLASLLNQRDFSASVAAADSEPVGLPTSEQQGLEKRPDIKSANSLIRAQDENINDARREWLPNFAVQAVASRNQGYAAAGDNTWSVSGQLTWQFWDGGRRFAHADQVRANREAARQQQLFVRNRARAERDAASAAWKAAHLQYEAAQAGLKAAAETEKIQSDRYKSGRLSAVDLLDAEAALSEARSNLSGAMADWWLADDQLHLAVGQAPAAYQRQHFQQSGNPSGGSS